MHGAVELTLRITDLEGSSVTQVHQGEPFLVESTVFDDQQVLGEPIIMHLEKLTMVQRYPVSTHITVINGKQQTKRTYVYKVRSDVLGQYALGPAYFDLGSQVIRSSALSFDVIKGSAVPIVQDADPFILVKSNKESAYVGEQVLLTVRLCYKKPIVSLALEPLKLTYATCLQLGPARQETFEYDGHSWSCFTYMFAIYPQNTGELIIPSLQAYGERDKESRGGFMAHFFFSFDREKIQVQSKPLVIAVKAIPAVAQNIIVGEFSTFVTELDKAALQPGIAATLTLTLVGNGNMHGIAFDELVLPKTIKKYESKTTLELDQQSGYLIRKQEIILQPLESGIFTLPAQIFNYFDPVSKTVKKLKTKPLVLSVKKGMPKNISEEPIKKSIYIKKFWPVIPDWLLVTLAISILLLLFGRYFCVLYAPYIEKKMAYRVFKLRVRHAKMHKNARDIYQAWFVLLEKRLGIDHVPKSLCDIEKFFTHDMRKKWQKYVEKLERLAFQERELFCDLNDLISQTYEWLENLEELL